MAKNLEHLSSEEINTLMRRYYSGETITKLLKEYNIAVPASNLYKLFPPIVSVENICKYCEQAVVIDRPSKSMKDIPLYKEDLYCPICKHRPFYDRCRCDNCLAEERLLQIKRIKQIKETYSVSPPPVHFSELTFVDKVYLGTVCRALLEEDMYGIKAYENADKLLAPTKELFAKIYNRLIAIQIIVVSPSSPLDAFIVDVDDFPNRYYLNKVSYHLNMLYPSDKQEAFTEILRPRYFSKDELENAYMLWKEIALAECIEYLQHQLALIRFDFNPGDKTKKTFELMLNDFSVSQIYGIIKKEVANASNLYLEKGLNRRHAANTVIGGCERYAERAKVNGWTLYKYNRIKDLPQSELSAFYFNRVLGIGDKGFNEVPSIDFLRSLFTSEKES